MVKVIGHVKSGPTQAPAIREHVKKNFADHKNQNDTFLKRD